MYARFYDEDVQEDGCTIHWGPQDDNTWILNDHGTVYYFELPTEIYNHWERSVGEQRRDAVRIKRDYFSTIVLFRRTDSGEKINVIRLSERFMRRAEETLQD